MGLFHAIYMRTPAALRRLFTPAVNCYRLFRCLRVELWSVSGVERHSQVSLSVLLAIPSEEKSYLTSLMFGACFQQLYLGRVWSWNIVKVAKKAGVDHSMILLRVEKPQFEVKARQGWFVIPNWVSGELALPHGRCASADPFERPP